ncbi:MAG: SEL1-like repeat protein [Spirochaetia bacterium]|nr:SEL1-like repeat protein [bacterium]MBR0318418.1 SEL1-like repeat protein [Spirochaetia bacterium]
MERGKFNLSDDNFDLEKCIIEAGKGNREAQESLAFCYIYGGHGIKADEAKGFQLALESARQGLPEGLYLLGECYECGYGIESDLKKAFDYYEKAAQKDYIFAIYDLGKFYLKGIVVEQDLKMGEKLLKKAADKDCEPAINLLANYYCSIDENEKTLKLLKRGKELGNPESQTLLGICYLKGIGVAPDVKKAIGLIQEAAEKYKYGDALYYLSELYAKGIGVEEDSAKAKYYYQQALETGYKPEKKALEEYYNENFEGEITIPQEGSINYIKGKEKIQTCVVYIESDTGSGSGFIISPDGYVATCAHVVDGSKELHIKVTGENNERKIFKGTIIKLKKETDTAIIKIENAPKLPFVELDDREKTEMEEDVVLYGYPLGNRLNDDVKELNISIAKGYISSHQVYEGLNITLLDISAKCGNSGSPVISCKNGKVTGIFSGSINIPNDFLVEEVNYMHPICYLKELLEEKSEPEPEKTVANSSEELAPQETEEISEEPEKKGSKKFWKWMKIGAIAAGGALLGAAAVSKKNK